MLDLTWLTGNTLLSCGYDTCARLWDTRCHNLTDFIFWRELNFFVYFLLQTFTFGNFPPFLIDKKRLDKFHVTLHVRDSCIYLELIISPS